MAEGQLGWYWKLDVGYGSWVEVRSMQYQGTRDLVDDTDKATEDASKSYIQGLADRDFPVEAKFTSWANQSLARIYNAFEDGASVLTGVKMQDKDGVGIQFDCIVNNFSITANNPDLVTVSFNLKIRGKPATI